MVKITPLAETLEMLNMAPVQNHIIPSDGVTSIQTIIDELETQFDIAVGGSLALSDVQLEMLKNKIAMINDIMGKI
jgi:hypothetical protein